VYNMKSSTKRAKLVRKAPRCEKVKDIFVMRNYFNFFNTTKHSLLTGRKPKDLKYCISCDDFFIKTVFFWSKKDGMIGCLTKGKKEKENWHSFYMTIFNNTPLLQSTQLSFQKSEHQFLT
jgi:hypothetical protein